MADTLEEQTQRALRQLREMQRDTQQSKLTDAAPDPEPSAPSPQPGAQSLLRFLRLDSDALLILPLILLLSREGADTALLLALVYILL